MPLLSWKPLLVLAALTVTTACSSLRDTAEPPARLLPISAEVHFKQRWSADTGTGSEHYLPGLRPALDADSIYVSDARGRVSAYAKRSGKRRWQRKLDTPISAASALADTALYLGSRDGELIALNKADGAELWRTALSGEVLAPPAVGLGVVVVHSADGALHGLAEIDGTLLWSNRRSVPPLSLRGSSTPVVEGGLAVAGMDNGRLLALSVLDGRVVWEVPLGTSRGRTELQRMTDADMPPVVEDGAVYAAAYQGRAVAVTLDTGRIRWARDISAYTGIGLDDTGALFVGDDNGQLWSLDKRNGATLWMQDKLRARHLTAPVNWQDTLLVADFEGYVHVLSTADGRLLGRKRYGDAGYIAPALVDANSVYLLNQEGRLTAFVLEMPERN